MESLKHVPCYPRICQDVTHKDKQGYSKEDLWRCGSEQCGSNHVQVSRAPQKDAEYQAYDDQGKGDRGAHRKKRKKRAKKEQGDDSDGHLLSGSCIFHGFPFKGGDRSKGIGYALDQDQEGTHKQG